MYRQSNLFRFQYILGLGCLTLTLLYFGMYWPLTQRVVELDSSLRRVWRALVEINLKNRARLGLDVETVSENLRLTEKAVSAVSRTSQRARARLEFPLEIRDKLEQPFQFLDYEQQRLQMIDDLRALAAAKKVNLEPAVTKGYPEYTFGKERPAFLWAQLAIANRILTAAVASGPETIRSIGLLATKSYPSPDGSRTLFDEYPARLEVAGSMESVFTFLLSLEGKPDEAKKGAASPAVPQQPALFVTQLILKGATNNPNTVALEAVISGFLDRENLP